MNSRARLRSGLISLFLLISCKALAIDLPRPFLDFEMQGDPTLGELQVFLNPPYIVAKNETEQSKVSLKSAFSARFLDSTGHIQILRIDSFTLSPISPQTPLSSDQYRLLLFLANERGTHRFEIKVDAHNTASPQQVDFRSLIFPVFYMVNQKGKRGLLTPLDSLPAGSSSYYRPRHIEPYEPGVDTLFILRENEQNRMRRFFIDINRSVHTIEADLAEHRKKYPISNPPITVGVENWDGTQQKIESKEQATLLNYRLANFIRDSQTLKATYDGAVDFEFTDRQKSFPLKYRIRFESAAGIQRILGVEEIGVRTISAVTTELSQKYFELSTALRPSTVANSAATKGRLWQSAPDETIFDEANPVTRWTAVSAWDDLLFRKTRQISPLIEWARDNAAKEFGDQKHAAPLSSSHMSTRVYVPADPNNRNCIGVLCTWLARNEKLAWTLSLEDTPSNSSQWSCVKSFRGLKFK